MCKILRLVSFGYPTFCNQPLATFFVIKLFTGVEITYTSARESTPMHIKLAVTKIKNKMFKVSVRKELTLGMVKLI